MSQSQYTSDSSGYNSDSSGHSASQRQLVQKVPLVAILEAKTENDGLTSIEFWKGQRPKQGSSLFAHGLGLSDDTVNAYTAVSSLKAKEEARQEKNSSKGHHRAPKDPRTFKHLRYLNPRGVPSSFLHGCQANRKQNPYIPQGMWGPYETLGDSLIPNIMQRTPRYLYRDDIPRVFSKHNKKGDIKSCWISATGQDEWHNVPGYTRKVKVSQLPVKVGDITKKKYSVLHKFVVPNVDNFIRNRELGKHPGRPRPSQRPPAPPNAGGSKSRRRLKRSFKRKTIKRRFKKR
jgi:hypothetical protein